MAKFCPSCGKPVPPNSKFCPECGASLKTGEAKTKKQLRRMQIPDTSPALRRAYLSISVLAVVAIVVAIAYNFILINKEKEKIKQGKVWNHPGVTSQQQPAAAAPAEAEPPIQLLQQREKELRAQIKNNPNSLDLNIQLGNVLFDSKKYGDAIPYYEKAVGLDPKNPDVIVDLGVSYFYLNQLDKAKNLFREALKLNPNHINALFNMGVVAVQTKELDLLMSSWGKLIKAAPNSPQAQQAQSVLDEIHKNTQKN